MLREKVHGITYGRRMPEDVGEACAGPDGDILNQGWSEAESSDDSVAEDMVDDVHDRESDPDWEPETVLAEVHVEIEEPEPEPGPSAKIPRLETRKRKGKGRGRSRERECGARQPSSPAGGMWCDTEEPDIKPTLPPFCPTRTPGSQLIGTSDYTVLELFQQFFTNTVLLTLINNTNVHGRATYSPWVDITLKDMFCFLSLVIYMGLLKVPALTDYWRQGRLYSLEFPKSVLSGRKFFSIVRALRLSSREADAENKGKRGTAEFDRLGEIKPLYTEIRTACRQNYQPDQHISIDERMVASKARVIFKQYLKSKPVRWGYKLFVIADSLTGYTWDFFVYEGKRAQSSNKGLSYDTVMSLLNTSLLGTGYKLYVDNFYTSPVLFKDLLQKNISACGTIRTKRQGYPSTTNNALDCKAPRGSIRWLREDPLLFVQWKDTRDVFMCSTMHTAHEGETVERKIKDEEGEWAVKDVPIPPAIKDYNKHMGGVDLSDALIGYYEVLHKTRKWYKTFFYHFVDIAIVNAFILHKAQCKRKAIAPMSQKTFRETLVLELADAGATRPPQQKEGHRDRHHRLVHISSSGDKTHGRLRCRNCQSKTPVKCATCDVSLCFLPTRDCYNKWHIKQEKK